MEGGVTKIKRPQKEYSVYAFDNVDNSGWLLSCLSLGFDHIIGNVRAADLREL